MAQAPSLRATGDAPAVGGVTPLDERGVRFQRRAVLAVTVIPFLGFVSALIGAWGWGVGGVDVAILIGFYVPIALGVTVGYHRLFTHRSFDAARPLRVLLAVLGSMAIQGSVITWVATHRRHHACADKEGDPHSPHLEDGAGIGAIARGLWHAHMGWLFRDEETEPKRWAPDLLKDDAIVKIDRAFPWLVLTSFVAPALVGFAVTRSLSGTATAFLWGGLVRIFMLHHVTWSINSICHFYGKRDFATTDHSTNNWVLSLVSLGESWHNNHHAFPTSAVHGIRALQLDLSGWVIRTCELLGLARNVRIVSEKQIAEKSLT